MPLAFCGVCACSLDIASQIQSNEAGGLCNVARFLPRMARTAPDQPALRAPTGTARDGRIQYDERSFRELDRLADSCARLLKERGLRPGDRCLLMVRPGMELVLLCFALFKMGVAPVVIDPGMGLRKFLQCVRRTRPEALVGIFPAIALSRGFAAAFSSVRVRVWVRGGGAFVREVEARAEGAPPYPLAETRADDLAAVLFTSGSTGPPKGVCYRHGMFEAQVRLIRDFYGIRPGEVDLPMLPVFALFNPAMGMTTVVPQMNPSRPATVDPARIVRAIRQNAVTNSFGSPVLWRKIGRYCLEKNIRLPTLRRILVAGAPVPPDLIRMYASILDGGELHTPYGATEALPVSSISGTSVLEETWALTEEGRGTCVGRVFPGMQVRILPVREGAVPHMAGAGGLPAGEIGEICVAGPVVTRSYDRMPAATAEAKIPDAEHPLGLWHRMGDLGYLDAEGRLWFCGRKAERVTLAGGEVLYTDPCEAIFNRHPDVCRSALIGLGPPGRQEPAVVIEPEPGKWPRSPARRRRFIESLEALRDAHSRLSAIRHFFFEKNFPVDVRHNAKIHRLSLKAKMERAMGKS